ncbi:uncharacterized protein LOC126738186 [Anthonomus grandis grandis]|uniref:uncharacterized protein LOC126738186 n=1 Tax=Anthonomus grandis grandis TaxID=2921223 RepID=UPI002165E124|nr:uncharacterized protein LOC126738186 [Anthonomus grandis grandis]
MCSKIFDLGSPRQRHFFQSSDKCLLNGLVIPARSFENYISSLLQSLERYRYQILHVLVQGSSWQRTAFVFFTSSFIPRTNCHAGPRSGSAKPTFAQYSPMPPPHGQTSSPVACRGCKLSGKPGFPDYVRRTMVHAQHYHPARSPSSTLGRSPDEVGQVSSHRFGAPQPPDSDLSFTQASLPNAPYPLPSPGDTLRRTNPSGATDKPSTSTQVSKLLSPTVSEPGTTKMRHS